MKRLGKQLISAALCVLGLYLLPFATYATGNTDCRSCSHQASVLGVHYDTLEAALAASPEGEQVTLLSDVTLPQQLSIEKTLTLDLGGNTLYGSLLLTADTTLRGGAVIPSDGPGLEVRDCTVILEEDFSLTGADSSPAIALSASSAPAGAAEESLQGGRTVLQVCGSIIAGERQPAIYSAPSDRGICQVYIAAPARLTCRQAPALLLACDGTLEITGGLLDTDTDCIAATSVQEVSVTGGTFRVLPSAHIPAFCRIRENPDGTFTVICAYTLTFGANGGSGTMEPLQIRFGDSIAVPQCAFTAPKGMDFAGWEIGGVRYRPGDIYTPGSDETAAAMWEVHRHTGGSATCLKRAVCTGCGKAYGNFGSHRLVAMDAFPATCTDAGMAAHEECRLCGRCFCGGLPVFTFEISFPATGHSWEQLEGFPADCENDGLRSCRKCKNCGVLELDGLPATEAARLIPALGHTLEAVDATQASCTSAGIRAHQQCTSCHRLFLQGDPVDSSQLTTALSSHILSPWQQDRYCHQKACVDCGEIFRRSVHTDADRNGLCDTCSYSLSEEALPPDRETAGFLPYLLIPAAIAAIILLILKKRK